VVAVLATVSACSSSSSGGSTGSSSAAPVTSSSAPSASSGTSASTTGVNCGTTDKTTVTIGLFGTFGYKENGLYDQYQKLCPNITIKEDDVEQASDYWTKLKTHLAAGSGVDDVQAIEVGFVADVVKNHADQFVNFQAQPNGAALKASIYPWKWGQATTADGKTTVGLGTDSGPQAICYRPDLYKAAGLPDNPTAVAAKLQTWDDFIAFGKQYESSSTKPKGSNFVDSASSVFNTAVYQGSEAYANESGQPDVTNSDGVKNAWKYATEAADAGITAKLQQFTPPWNKAFSSGTFATIACPTWMMGYIQGQAGDAGKGKWDIAPVLPGGAANWGGSFLGVPAKAKNQAAGLALAEWLTAKQQAVSMWAKGLWPANQEAAADPGVKDATNAYFNNAPVGKIFGAIASKLALPPISPYDTQIQTAFNTQLTNVETKGTSPDKAFADALAAIKQVTG
jgi:cellobiose transport system substrate-binding protein